ncbi:MAG: DUF4147 domain-containing protein [Planctomycetales bacterium]|nr:DUF4147 domain-containing protein [Planctomycetales bacterium]
MLNLNATEAAFEIWQAGLDAVRSDRAVTSNLHASISSDGTATLRVAAQAFTLPADGRVCVVGAGKAGAGMVKGIEAALRPLHLGERLFGWVNVPEGPKPADLTSNVVLHHARPAGVNEPTLAAVEGTKRIVELVEHLHPSDLCICLLSGGGSALLPLPTDDISLEEKVQLTRDLSAAGATIQQLNAVRQRFSRVKAGGLAGCCSASNLVSLIISDVIGDPLDVIASGPTVVQRTTKTSLEDVWERLVASGAKRSAEFVRAVIYDPVEKTPPPTTQVLNTIIANNQTAVEAAREHASRIGFKCIVLPPESATTTADELGASLAIRLLKRLRDCVEPTCIITGGEPVVHLSPAANRGRGGRNQQLVLAALNRLLPNIDEPGNADFAILSGGTDGEDGPTDAAGAICNQTILQRYAEIGLDPAEYLARNDAYSFFEQAGGLFRTGPTNTNVCDVRVITISC